MPLSIYSRGLKLKLVGGPHSRDKMPRGPQFIRKKLLRAAIYMKSPQNKLNLVKYYTLGIFLRCSRAAQMHLAGHMRPAGRVFENPDLQ